MDYYEERKEGQELKDNEIKYITNDVLIVSKALDVLFKEGLNKMTQGGNALSNYKELFGKYKFFKYYPYLETEVDEDIRRSYKGGFTYLNPIYKEKDVENIVNLDVNSLYPSVMRYEKLPYGEPIFYEGKYEPDVIYNLYIQKITCSFKLKKNHIPTIQIKHSYFNDNEYLESSNR